MSRYVMRRDGREEVGRPEDEMGAHVRGWNRTSIGICLVGDTNADDRGLAEFNFTMPQLLALTDRLNHLARDWPTARPCGHRDLDPRKACPCFTVAAWWGGPTLRPLEVVAKSAIGS